MESRFSSFQTRMIVLLAFFTFFTGVSSGQNVDGEDYVCAGVPYWYRADPLGGNHKTWGINGGNFYSGTHFDDEIQVVWFPVGEGDISWIAYPGGDGGSLEVTIVEAVAPSNLHVDCVLGTNTVQANTDAVPHASQYHWTITGFGLGSPLTTTTSSPLLSTQVPDTNVPGTVCVKAYFSACAGYGPQSCESFP